MSHLRVKPSLAPDPSGRVVKITPQSAGWSYVGFSLVRLKAGAEFGERDERNETCLVVVAGTAHLYVSGKDYGPIGGRASPFDDQAPGAAFVPAGEAYRLVAVSDIELAICTAPGSSGYETRVISGDDMPREVRGSGTNTRYVRNILPQDRPAHSLLVVEVVTPGGHWSSYPPHKHDTAEVGAETALEETYFHRLNPPQGFAFQRVYTDDRSLDETVLIENGDVVLVPKGYHPVGTPHGYDLYYLNVMAGPERHWIFRNDPAHEWMLFSPTTRQVRRLSTNNGLQD